MLLGLFNFIAARWGMAAAYRISAIAPLVLIAVVLAAGAWAGWSLGRAPLQVDLAQLKQSQAETAHLGALASARRLEQAQRRGDRLTHALLNSQRAIQQLTQEKNHAITQVTTGRTCLDGAALRVLHGSPGLSVQHADQLPPTSSSPAAADGPVATDTGVAAWAIQSGAQYQTCRERLQALIDWHSDKDHQEEGAHED